MKEPVRGRYFEDYEEGETFLTAGRTITEADLVNFAGVSGDFDQAHTNKEYAKESVFGQRLVYGVFIIAVWSGLLHRLGYLHGTSMGFLEMDIDFERPTYIGDTLWARMTVTEKRETSKDDRGVVIFKTDMINQDEETVATLNLRFMIARRQCEESSIDEQ